MDGKWIIFSFCIVGACCASDNPYPLFVGASCARDLFLQLDSARDNLCPLFVGASCARDLFLQLGGARDNR